MELVTRLRTTRILEERVPLLKGIKNELVGHDQRKEAAVRAGLLDLLVHILANDLQHSPNGLSSTTVNDNDELVLQATLVLATLANGGPSLVAPLLAAAVPDVLLTKLASCATPTLATAILQALKNLTSSCTALQAASPSAPKFDLFSREHIDTYMGILNQPFVSAAAQQHLRLIAELITFTSMDNETKARLAASPLLDTITSLLAAHALACKHVENHCHPSSLPHPPPASIVPSLLSAVSAIVSGSVYRVHRFLYSSALHELFLIVWPPDTDQRYLYGARHGFQGTSGEPLLPPLNIPAYGTTTYGGMARAFPVLAALQRHTRRGTLAATLPGGDIDHTNAVCSWLLLLARSWRGHDRLIALRLLALVNNAVQCGPLDPRQYRTEVVQKDQERERQMALLAVPLAVRLVQTANESKSSDLTLRERQDAALIREEACEVLALLVQSYKSLQVAAFDAGAVKYICPLLKKSFDNVPLAKPMWSAKSADSLPGDSPSRRLGSRGLPPEIVHTMRCREGALRAIAALADKEDLHRKAIVDAGVVGCMIDSLTPYPPDFMQKLDSARAPAPPKDGNTIPVILAACTAVRTMSRSVSLLRTSLIDAGVAKPVFQLMGHENPQIQLAATEACVNLLLDFSPMRDDLIAEGVIEILTEHARRSVPPLRVQSLWAIKHLVMNTSKELKLHTLKELGTGWLVSAIQGGHKDVLAMPSGGGVGLSTPNAAGEQVDLLNPSTMDIDDPSQEYEEDDDGEMMYDEQSSTHYQASQLRSTLSAPNFATFNRLKYLRAVRDSEQDPVIRAKRDEIDVQVQALDIVRNLLTGDDCAVMLDHLLQQIGTAKLFDLLTTKLSPLPSSARLTGNSNRLIYNPTEIILSAVSIIQHIANAAARHKQLLIAQSALLQAWKPHFSHANAQVRVACVWAIISLTWVEDETDRTNARTRVHELASAGIIAKLRDLANTENDTDVKERLKTAIRQIDVF